MNAVNYLRFQILKTIKNEWDLLEALHELVNQSRGGRKKDHSGLDPIIESPFLDLVIEGKGNTIPGSDEILVLSKHTLEIIQIIKNDLKLKDFWINPQLHSELMSKIVTYLDKNEIIPFENLESTAKKLIDLSETLHMRLTS